MTHCGVRRSGSGKMGTFNVTCIRAALVGLSSLANFHTTDVLGYLSAASAKLP
jgi:hypothetical protein